MELDRALLAFQQVGKEFSSQRRSVAALTDISFELRRGDFVTLVGPSGCGKSTLLRLAAGLEMPTTGRVVFDAKDVTGPDRERGMVFQSYSAFPWLTVRENIAFGLSQSERLSHPTTEGVAHWLHRMSLQAFADAYPKDLSGGMRQRLALARALIVKPRLLLMDEPFGALDEHTRTAMQQLLLDLVSQQQCTVLFVTHDIRESMILGDRILLMSARPGKVLREFVPQSAKPRDRAYRLSKEFFEMYEEIVKAFPAQTGERSEEKP